MVAPAMSFFVNWWKPMNALTGAAGTLLTAVGGALGVDRTRDLSLTKGVLYH
jgi:hypothetical protein